MKAAMIAIMSNGMVFSKADEIEKVKDIMTRLNHSLYLKTDERMYTALCLASLDIVTREFTFSLAAFNEPLLKTKASTVNLQAAGTVFPVGAFKDSTYEQRTVTMKTGDVIVIYTDGISEAWVKKDEFYETKRLRDFLYEMDTSVLSAREINRAIIEDVKNYYGGVQQRDDMTIVAIKAI